MLHEIWFCHGSNFQAAREQGAIWGSQRRLGEYSWRRNTPRNSLFHLPTLVLFLGSRTDLMQTTEEFDFFDAL